MSTLRITNIEAKADPSSPTVDEKIKLTNSNGDILVHIDGKTSGITTIGINTTAGNIKFDQNSNVVVTGIITATKFVGTIEPTSLEIGSNIKLGNAGVITATSYVGDGSALTGIDATQIQTGNTSVQTVDTGSNGHVKINTEGTERLRITSAGNMGVGNADPTQAKLVAQTASGSSLAAIKDNTGGSIVIGGVTQPRILMEAGHNASELRIYSAGGSSYGSASWTERLRITSGGNLQLYAGGNLQMASNGRIFVGNGGNATDPMFANVSDTNTGIAFPAADTMMFTTGGSERLRITSTARFGFNTAIPPRDYCFHSGQADTNIQITNNTTGVDDSAGALIQQDGNDLYIWNKENSFMSLGTNAGERVRISNIGHVITKGNNQGNSVGIEIKNVNTNAYSHAELALTSQNATTSKIWCDVPNSGMRLNYNGGTSVKINQSGNIVMANGGGIDFSATGDGSGTVVSELFDDYEEGSFTPTVEWGGTSATLTGGTYGRYTKIGNTVIINFRIIQSSRNATSGSFRMYGLPYNEGSSAAYNHGMVQMDSGGNMPSGAGSIMMYFSTNNVRFLYQTNSVHSDLDASHCVDGTAWYGFATYFTS